MREAAAREAYRPTESQYVGGAQEMYITYDLEQRTRGGGRAIYPKVKRVYLAGDVRDWKAGSFAKRTGKEVHGVKITYERSRKGYERKGFTATRGNLTYEVRPAHLGPTRQTFTHVVEIPAEARNIRFHTGELPTRYREALQDIR